MTPLDAAGFDPFGKCLQSGFLSTFRFSLLALNDFDYRDGLSQIDNYFDSLSIGWQATNTRDEADALERDELQGGYHYPLNIQGNRRPELREYVRHLKSMRQKYIYNHIVIKTPG